jgi:hypothetical protein
MTLCVFLKHFWFFLILCLPFVLCDKNGEYFFVFCPRKAKWGSLLVFYVGNILDDKNTLCNSCILTG